MAARLLIVESEKRFQENLMEHLRHEGFSVFGSAGEMEAQAILEEHDIDVVVLGLQGYGAKGLHLLDRIKTGRPQAQVIVMVPGGEVSLSIEGMKRGAFDDISVPVDLSALVEKIREACLWKRKAAKHKKSFKERVEDWMVAASFAEAGSPQVARDMLQKDPESPGKKRPKR